MNAQLELMHPELRKVSPLRDSNYIIVLCLTEKVAHFLYRLEGRKQELHPSKSKYYKSFPGLFRMFLRNNAKTPNSFKIMKNCPQTWLVLARLLKKYPDELMVWGGNRIYNFHMPENILKAQGNLNNILSRTNENLEDEYRATVLINN